LTQEVEIINLKSFGRSLVLDGMMQSCEHDERAYHESLVHPSVLTALVTQNESVRKEMLSSHPNSKAISIDHPLRVFIGGGGEGATVREVLKYHPNVVAECVMVDIDGDCVEMCQQYLPTHHENCFYDEELEFTTNNQPGVYKNHPKAYSKVKNPRLTVLLEDAFEILSTSPDGSWDVIILDLVDPSDPQFSRQFYSVEWYEMCRRKLSNKGGVLVTQSAPAGILTCHDVFGCIVKTVSEAFGSNLVAPYTTFVPAFLDDYGYTLAVKTELESFVMPNRWSVDQVNFLISSFFKPVKNVDIAGESAHFHLFHTLLHVYDGTSHQRMFHLMRPIRRLIETETRIIRKVPKEGEDVAVMNTEGLEFKMTI